MFATVAKDRTRSTIGFAADRLKKRLQFCIPRGSAAPGATTGAPQMFPWAKCSLVGKNLLVCQEEIIHGIRGVQQGSPLAPLFFSLALQEVLTEVRPLFDESSWKIWYLDDGTLFGKLEPLEMVLAPFGRKTSRHRSGAEFA